MVSRTLRAGLTLEAVAAAAVAYLIGSIDFGVLVSRARGVDIYQQGSGNPGASNVLRTQGKAAFALTLAGDLAKGAAAAALGDLWVGGATGYACLLAAVAGHCYPIFHRFHGGKGVAAAIGGLLWLIPVVGAASLVAWAGIVGLWKMASVASLLIAGAWVPLVAWLRGGWALVWTSAAVALIVWRHRANITRLKNREERRLLPG